MNGPDGQLSREGCRPWTGLSPHEQVFSPPQPNQIMSKAQGELSLCSHFSKGLMTLEMLIDKPKSAHLYRRGIEFAINGGRDVRRH
jgi:hypothetical protein